MARLPENGKGGHGEKWGAPGSRARTRAMHDADLRPKFPRPKPYALGNGIATGGRLCYDDWVAQPR